MTSHASRPGQTTPGLATEQAEYHDLVREYFMVTSWDRRVTQFDRISALHTLGAQLFSTEAAIELASGAAKDSDRDALVDRALGSAQNAGELAAKAPTHTPHTINASILLPYVIPLISAQVYHQPTGAEQLSLAHGRNHDSVAKAAAAIHENDRNIDAQTKHHLEEALAKSYVLQSLHKIALAPEVNLDWVALPATRKQPPATAGRSSIRPSWSLSVYENGSVLAEPIHKIETRRQRSWAAPDIRYANGIKVIYVKEDLSLEGEHSSGRTERRQQVSLNRLMRELSPDASPSQQMRWERRRAKILEALTTLF